VDHESAADGGSGGGRVDQESAAAWIRERAPLKGREPGARVTFVEQARGSGRCPHN